MTIVFILVVFDFIVSKNDLGGYMFFSQELMGAADGGIGFFMCENVNLVPSAPFQ